MKVMCNISKSFVIKSLLLFLINIAACKPDPFIDGEGKTAIKMKIGNNIMEREKFDLTGEHIFSVEEIDENSFYYRGLGNSIGKVENFKHQWLQKDYVTEIKTIKSKNKQLNNGLLSCLATHGSSFFQRRDEWQIKVYNSQGNLQAEKIISSPFPKATIYGIHQVEITPSIILSEYAKKGVDTSNYNANFEVFAIIGADGQFVYNSSFIYFVAVSYEPNIEIISIPNFVKANTKRVTQYALEHFGSGIPPVIPSLSVENCSNSNRLLSGSSSFIAMGRSTITRLSINLNSDVTINSNNCTVSKAFFTYDVEIDWSAHPLDKPVDFNFNSGKQVLVDTSNNKCNIYVAGNYSYPENAWIASLTCDGKINWVKEYYGLEGSIEFDAMLLDQDEIIVCGSTGYDFSKKQLYGYVGMMDKNSGKVIAQRYFGKPKKYRSLSTMFQRDDYIYVWGEDEYNYGWSFKIKKSNL